MKKFKVKNILESNNDFKIFYDGPCYWKCFKADNKMIQFINPDTKINSVFFLVLFSTIQ